jgi:hypothetical protein
MSTSAGGADRAVTWIAALFMIGSACFAVPSVPGVAAVAGPAWCGLTYFVGSIFFTSAAALVTVGLARSGALASLDGWAAMIQLAGTLWFNLNTFHAMTEGLSAHQENLRVWTPDMLGSVCFLVSSELSVMAVCGTVGGEGSRRRARRAWCWCRGDRDWTVAVLNLVGSVFFMVSAIAAFTRPATDVLLDASLANSGTLLGALCFFWGARLLLPTRARETTPT